MARLMGDLNYFIIPEFIGFDCLGAWLFIFGHEQIYNAYSCILFIYDKVVSDVIFFITIGILSSFPSAIGLM